MRIRRGLPMAAAIWRARPPSPSGTAPAISASRGCCGRTSTPPILRACSRRTDGRVVAPVSSKTDIAPSPAAAAGWGTVLGRLALLWLAGADLRLTMLSGLPVLLLGLAAVPGSLLIARLGPRRAAIAALLLIAAASAARGIGPSAPLLFTMTVLMGAGVALLQPALPSLVGAWFAA